MQGDPDVEFPGEDTAGNLGTENFAGDDGHVGVVVLDGREDRPEGLEAGRRGEPEAQCSGDARAGKPGALGGALERGERERRLFSSVWPAAVSLTSRLVRTNSCVPRVRSSLWIWLLSDGWEM